jgi:ABC-type transport system involved in multi-copper enzyme maturation permease subunit
MLPVFAFELRQQLRSHVFWIVFAISGLMVAGALWIPDLRVGLSATGSINGVGAILRTHLVWTLFYMFTAAALSADAVLRDDLTGFAPIIHSTPMRRRDYLLGRFLGAYAATIICFLSVPAAMMLAGLSMQSSGSTTPTAHVYAFLVIAIPNLFTGATLFFVLATALRSMLGALLGAVALLSLYGLGAGGGMGGLRSLLDPFGFTAIAEATAGWSEFDKDARLPDLAGTLLLNRLVWIVVSCGILAVLVLAPRRKWRPVAMRAAPPPEEEGSSAWLARTLPEPKHDRFTFLRQAIARTGLELRQLLSTPAFAVLLLLGLGNAAATNWQLFSDRTDAGTHEVIATLIDAFDLVPIVVAIFFAGELSWNEREHRIKELIGVTPAPDAALLLPKTLALGLALLALALASAAPALVVPGLRGAGAPAVPDLLLWYVVPKWFDWLLLGVLALFLQSLAPNKLAGWGLIVLYLIASLALEQMGFTEPIYRYGSYPGFPLSEPLSGETGTLPYRFYWSAFALLLTVLAYALLARGQQDALGVRLSDAPRRLTGVTGLAASGAALAFIALGSYLAVR